MNIAIIGGGAAGFFAAITCAEANSACRVTIFERGKSVLEKVRVSGGGRCNATHACFDPRELVKNYPRGSRELLGPFMQFGPEQTVEWFAQRGVRLKTEEDGRMFPITDDSQTIIDCLSRAAHQAGVRVLTSTRVDKLERAGSGWRIGSEVFDKVMLATGSSTTAWDWLRELGHTIVAPVPSLFTFNTKDARLRELAGVSVPLASVSIPGTKLSADGPLLAGAARPLCDGASDRRAATAAHAGAHRALAAERAPVRRAARPRMGRRQPAGGGSTNRWIWRPRALSCRSRTAPRHATLRRRGSTQG